MNYIYKNTKVLKHYPITFCQRRLLLNKGRARERTTGIVVDYKSICSQPVLYKNSFNANCGFFHNDVIEHDIVEENDIIKDGLQYDETMQYQSIRNILYPKSKDPYIIKLNQCASVQEVFDFIKENVSKMQHNHTAQAVLVLWDLKKLFLYAHQTMVASDDISVKDQVQQLINHVEFQQLLKLIKNNYIDLDMEALSCVLLYLSKIGIDVKHDVLQLLIRRLSNSSSNDMSLSALSRFIVATSKEQNLSKYLMFQDRIPYILESLEKCESAEDLKLITICLDHLDHIVRNDLLELYQNKIIELIENNVLTTDYSRTILKIVMFLSNPRWNNTCILMSRLMRLLKDKFHTLNVYDFLIAYEILYRNHEPGDILTEMQRCSARLLLALNEECNLPTEIKLKLLSCTVCFLPTKQRPEYEKMLLDYIKSPLTLPSIYDLLRVLTFVKPDSKLCDEFWNGVLTTVNSQEGFKDSDNLLRLSQRYMHFSNDVNYRHNLFEKCMLKWLKNEMRNGMISLIPTKNATACAFILSYETDPLVIEDMLKRISENWEQFNHVDCLHISKGLGNIDMKRSPIANDRFNLVNNAIDKVICEKLILMRDDAKANILVKSCIYRRTCNKQIIEKLLLNLNPNQVLSSHAIRNLVFNFQSTGGLIPDMINNITKYVIDYKDNLLGFNAEKVAYLCYYLGYSPEHSDELFQAVTDIILRDQERISGLSYIQAALSLCFFHKLPESFIKNIFNVNFLERLDAELSTCYFKDVYPIRVRNNMMQLNRAVCLDYPQSNIPWFHQKHIEQLRQQKAKVSRQKGTTNINNKFKSYLLRIMDDPAYLTENVYSPYGYHIDFLLNLDCVSRLFKSNEDDKTANRLAILLLNSNAYTKINVQLKGEYQLKKRHLEILGYKVLPINVNDWNSLISGEEKLESINKLIWPEDINIASQSYTHVNR